MNWGLVWGWEEAGFSLRESSNRPYLPTGPQLTMSMMPMDADGLKADIPSRTLAATLTSLCRDEHEVYTLQLLPSTSSPHLSHLPPPFTPDTAPYSQPQVEVHRRRLGPREHPDRPDGHVAPRSEAVEVARVGSGATCRGSKRRGDQAGDESSPPSSAEE